MDFSSYDTEGFYDEMFTKSGQPQLESLSLIQSRIESLSNVELLQRQQDAERIFRNLGITFNVNGSEEGCERIFPFDLIPRIVGAIEWAQVAAGLKQRIQALNAFIHDIYHQQKVLTDSVVPRELIETCDGYLPQCVGIRPPQNAWCHIVGTDLVRDINGQFHVLEDNLRCPSGVSYVLENRLVMKRIFPELFDGAHVQPVSDYPARLLANLCALSPKADPTVVLLTPGLYNAAYFEHSFLAREMGIELVEGRDLLVRHGYLYMKTTRGLKQVDVVYRRISDDFLDPEVFRQDSLLGVPGLMAAYRSGRVAIANAPGTGVADDKVIYAFVPDLIRYYLAEEPLLPNVPTYLCWNREDRDYVLAHIDKLVVKEAAASGGYGMLIGPHADNRERQRFRQMILSNPRNYIAQPTVQLSRVPTLTGTGVEGRHVDLRPYILHGVETYVMPGGLTRVAFKKGSLVVNSSQGGGSKDTWVLSNHIH